MEDEMQAAQAAIRVLATRTEADTDGYAIWAVVPNVPIPFGGWRVVFSADLPRPYHVLVRRATAAEDLAEAGRMRAWAEAEQRRAERAEDRLVDLRAAARRAVETLLAQRGPSVDSVVPEELAAAVAASYAADGDR